MKLENGTSAAFPSTDCVTFAYDGLTKREYACIKLGIPETGDEELDDLIRKSERKRLAASAMQGLLSLYDAKNALVPNSENIKYMADLSVLASDELLKQLEK